MEQSTAFLAADEPLHGIALRPRLLTLAPLMVLAALGWIYLGLMIGATTDHGHALGPGFGLLDRFVADGAGRAWIEALCRPAFARSTFQIGTASGPWSVIEFLLAFVMWSAMIAAMMLPTAAPMVLTYAEIAATASAKREPVVSPLLLTAGYLVIWLAFAMLAAGLQWGLARLVALDPALTGAGGLFSAAIFLAAGAYQFSALKHACLTVCQRPFPYLFGHWSREPKAVFRLGMRQGLYCIGCCWAMMLVMFAVGVMNVVWMAGLGAVMAAEKTMSTSRLSHVVGVVLLALGLILVVASAIEHWPVRTG